RVRLFEAGDSLARPRLLPAVPPDVALPLRPRLAVRVGRRAVVQQTPVRRPCPRPFRRDPALLPVGLAPRRLILVVGEAAGVDPAAARRRAVVLQLRVTGERLLLLVPAVDLAQHGLGARLLDAG